MNLTFLTEIAKYIGAIILAWCGYELAGLFVTYNSLFPVWAMAIVTGVGMMLIATAYRRERKLLSRRRGAFLVTLRCISFGIVAFMLMQPVLMRTVTRKIERTVAVLLDTSDSMRFEDGEWSPSERLSFAYEAGLVDQNKILLPSLEPLEDLRHHLVPWLESDFADGKTPPAYRKLVSQSRSTARNLVKELTDDRVAESTNAVLKAFERQLTTSLLPSLESLERGGRRESAAETLAAFAEKVPEVRTAADEVLWSSMPSNQIEKIVAYTTTNRMSLALAVLTNSLPALSDDYDVRYFSFGRGLIPASLQALADSVRDESQSTATDFAAALEGVMTSVPSEQLAGVLMLTDGLDNGDAAIEPVARRLGMRGVHVNTIAIGSTAPPRDLALADISAPESIFLGDKARIHAKLSATGARGTEAKVSLLLDGEKIDETTIPISEDEFRRDFSMAHAPTNNGLSRYELRIDEIDGERFPSNNSWKVDVAVSDDRTHVLIVDDRPRWDFRYLRNLFYARDKSVHLQYYLVHPDSILGVDVTNHPPAASASRPFGEAEAGALPESEEEWRKFDAIILGDVGPDVISNDTQRIIAKCVEERGSMLVTIAGPRAMPHAYKEDSPLREILPCVFETPSANADFWEPPEKHFSIALTPAGRIHPVTQQSSSTTENEQLWSSLPKCTWRFPVLQSRAGAEVIAFAQPEGDEDSGPAVTAANAVELMDAEKANRDKRALIVAQNLGRGKVLQINTDESWRLRYRTGDTRHHKFWGQVVRWGLGERLRSGTQRLRVGTERMTYTPHDSIRVLARILDEEMEPVTKAKPFALIRPEGTNTVSTETRIALSYVTDSQGLYEAILPPITETGAYTVSIETPWKWSGEDKERAVSTMFFVAAARRPIEMARVAASRENPLALAQWTGGHVVAPHEAKTLANSFGEKSRTITEPLEISLWDSKWLLILLSASLITEWILRKRGGLV